MHLSVVFQHQTRALLTSALYVEPVTGLCSGRRCCWWLSLLIASYTSSLSHSSCALKADAEFREPNFLSWLLPPKFVWKWARESEEREKSIGRSAYVILMWRRDVRRWWSSCQSDSDALLSRDGWPSSLRPRRRPALHPLTRWAPSNERCHVLALKRAHALN